MPGVFCFEGDWGIEGDWGNRLDDTKTVLPLLETAQRVLEMPFVHRAIGTKGELDHYVGRWLENQHSRYTIGHFAFHGDEDGLGLSQEDISLDDLALTISAAIGGAAGRIVYFDSCGVLADRTTALDFMHKTQAEAVVGYSKNVTWMESAAFDLLLFYALGTEDTAADARSWLTDTYPDVCHELGLEFLIP